MADPRGVIARVLVFKSDTSHAWIMWWKSRTPKTVEKQVQVQQCAGHALPEILSWQTQLLHRIHGRGMGQAINADGSFMYQQQLAFMLALHIV